MKEQPHSKPVVQMTHTGRLIEVYLSVSKASRMTGISRTAITNALSQRSGIHLSGGYIWKYVSDLM